MIKPFAILVENNPSRGLQTAVSRLESTPGIAGAAAPSAWRTGSSALIEAFPRQDGAASPSATRSRTFSTTSCPRLERQIGGGVKLTLGGVAPEDRDFVHAVYGKFPYVLLFVILLTFVLLMRAFRSVFLSIKAVFST